MRFFWENTIRRGSCHMRCAVQGLFTALLLLLVSGCASVIRAERFPPVTPVRIASSAPVFVETVVFEIEPGRSVGGYAPSISRPYQELHLWQESFSVSPREFSFALQDELASHGYQVSAEATAPFVLRPVVTGMVYNLFGSNERVGWTEADIEVRWELKGPDGLTRTTRGYGHARPHSLASLFNACRASLRAFLAVPEVARAVQGDTGGDRAGTSVTESATPEGQQQNSSEVSRRGEPAAAPENVVSPVQRAIPRPTGLLRSLDDPAFVQWGRRGVVTVLTGDRWGSGTIVSADGLIVIASQLAAHSTVLKVVTYDGREHEAKVLRSDASLGVSLVSVDGARFQALPFRLQQAVASDAVVVLGTPSHPSLSHSQVRGRITGIDGSRLRSNALVNAGNWGGPILAKDGVVLGIVTPLSHTDSSAREASGLSAGRVFSGLGLAYTE